MKGTSTAKLEPARPKRNPNATSSHPRQFGRVDEPGPSTCIKESNLSGVRPSYTTFCDELQRAVVSL